MKKKRTVENSINERRTDYKFYSLMNKKTMRNMIKYKAYQKEYQKNLPKEIRHKYEYEYRRKHPDGRKAINERYKNKIQKTQISIEKSK